MDNSYCIYNHVYINIKTENTSTHFKIYQKCAVIFHLLKLQVWHFEMLTLVSILYILILEDSKCKLFTNAVMTIWNSDVNNLYIGDGDGDMLILNLHKWPVKIYQSRGPTQNIWGQGLFSCLQVMGLCFSNEHGTSTYL